MIEFYFKGNGGINNDILVQKEWSSGRGRVQVLESDSPDLKFGFSTAWCLTPPSRFSTLQLSFFISKVGYYKISMQKSPKGLAHNIIIVIIMYAFNGWCVGIQDFELCAVILMRVFHVLKPHTSWWYSSYNLCLLQISLIFHFILFSLWSSIFKLPSLSRDLDVLSLITELWVITLHFNICL